MKKTIPGGRDLRSESFGKTGFNGFAGTNVNDVAVLLINPQIFDGRINDETE